MRLALSLGLTALSVAAAAGAAPSSDPAVTVLEQGYVAAWDRADPRGIAAFFAADGDFTNPTGFHAQGRAAIAGFYAQAFAMGYAGSRGAFTAHGARQVAPGVIVVDGEWSIRDARTPQGAARPPEQGRATAVLLDTKAGWRIAALREQADPPPE